MHDNWKRHGMEDGSFFESSASPPAGVSVSIASVFLGGLPLKWPLCFGRPSTLSNKLFPGFWLPFGAPPKNAGLIAGWFAPGPSICAIIRDCSSSNCSSCICCCGVLPIIDCAICGFMPCGPPIPRPAPPIIFCILLAMFLGPFGGSRLC